MRSVLCAPYLFYSGLTGPSSLPLSPDFAIDKAGQAYAVCSNLTSMQPVTWGSFVGMVDFAEGTTDWMSVVPVTAQDVFGSVVGGGCKKPGRSKGAAKKCYSQLNDGLVGQDGVFFVTAFDAGPPETVLGVDLATGVVVFEQGPSDSVGGNL
eukprot:SAG22_NODE_6407_length_860_cov_1.482260_2_plen_151_part_01